MKTVKSYFHTIAVIVYDIEECKGSTSYSVMISWYPSPQNTSNVTGGETKENGEGHEPQLQKDDRSIYPLQYFIYNLYHNPTHKRPRTTTTHDQ